MKNFLKNSIVISFLFFLVVNTYIVAQEDQKKDEKQFTSLWEGKLKISSVSLRIVLKVFNNSDGSLGAFMDSPDQGAKDIPVSSISINEDSLIFAIQSIGGSFAGKIIKDSAIVKGTFRQGGMSLPLDLKKIEKLTEIKRPQEPKKPYPYNDEEVTIENKSSNITLSGSFTYPKTGGKFPVVVLVTGSGPQDRDETLGGGINHKPFLVLSDYLTHNGIAVLRYDDRGIGKSKGDFTKATTEDFAADAQAAVEYLKTRKEIDPKKIGIAGHSEGGLIAPIVAVNSNDVSYIVLLAGPGLPGKDILLLQGRLISKANGDKDEEIDKAMNLNEKMYDVILSETDDVVADKKIKELFEEYISTLGEEEKKKAEIEKPMMERSLKQLSSLIPARFWKA